MTDPLIPTAHGRIRSGVKDWYDSIKDYPELVDKARRWFPAAIQTEQQEQAREARRYNR